MLDMINKTQAKRRTYTPEQRAAQAAYLRDYRRRNPDRVRQWRDNYVLRRAEKLLRAQAEGGVDHGGD